jgi:DNA-directed RNA polymerase alpha subunit
MDPRISNVIEDAGVFKFTLSNINVSLANALRRTILTDIPINVIRTETYETNQCQIQENTSRLHNEIVKQRLSCIPIHTKDLKVLPENVQLEVDVKNDTDNIIYVTTEHFKLKNKKTGAYLPAEEVRRIFPPCLKTNSYIDFVRLRPKISDMIPGEQLKLVADFSVGTAKENGMFNAVSKCSYGNTLDMVNIDKVWAEREAKLRADEVPSNDIQFQKRNFMLLDAQRIFTPDSFDFVIQTVGIYENQEIVKMAAKILTEKFAKFVEELDSNIVSVINSETTMDNCFDILLENEDYTMGKAIEYILYAKYYEGDKTLDFCGFKKFHPHDVKSTVRIAFRENSDKTIAKQYVRTAANELQEIFKIVYKMF